MTHHEFGARHASVSHGRRPHVLEGTAWYSKSGNRSARSRMRVRYEDEGKRSGTVEGAMGSARKCLRNRREAALVRTMTGGLVTCDNRGGRMIFSCSDVITSITCNRKVYPHLRKERFSLMAPRKKPPSGLFPMQGVAKRGIQRIGRNAPGCIIMDRVTRGVERRMKMMTVKSIDFFCLTWATSSTHVCGRMCITEIMSLVLY